MLSANAKFEGRVSVKPKASIQVTNTRTVFSGGYIALVAPANSVAGDPGRLRQWDTTVKDVIPFGWKILDQVLGNTSPAAGTQIPEGELDMGTRIAEQVPITGLAGSQADVGKIVYMSDDNTFTLTRPSHGIPAGIVVANRANSAASADVYLFSVETLLAISMGGGAHLLQSLGVIDAISLANATTIAFNMTSHGRLNKVYAICKKVPTGAGAAATLTPNIGGVNCSAGVISLALADTLYLQKTGTAFTAGSALDVFHEGDVLNFAVSGVTAFTAGLYDLYADYILEGGI